MVTLPTNQFMISDNAINGLSELKVGQEFKALISYLVVEETKSYTMIRIKYLNPDYGKRKF